VDSSAVNPIFMPYVETADKVNDTMSLSFVSQNAELDEINVARYSVNIISHFIESRHIGTVQTRI